MTVIGQTKISSELKFNYISGSQTMAYEITTIPLGTNSLLPLKNLVLKNPPFYFTH